MDSSTWSRRLPSSPGGVCPSLISGILCVLLGPTSHPLRASTSQVKHGWFSPFSHCEPTGLMRDLHEPWRPHQQSHCSFFLENIFKASSLPTCQASPGLGNAQVSCCSSAHQLFHEGIQVPCVASSRPPNRAEAQTLPGVCEFEYSWPAGSQGLSCSVLRSVRGALNGRIVTCAERGRHGVSNYSSFQTTASCFGLLEQ